MVLAVYLIIINVLTALLMLIDKQNAINKKRRIPEKTLIWLAIAGGSFGELMGMYLFRHKTKHLKFSIGLPVILAVHIILILVSLWIPFL